MKKKYIVGIALCAMLVIVAGCPMDMGGGGNPLIGSWSGTISLVMFRYTFTAETIAATVIATGATVTCPYTYNADSGALMVTTADCTGGAPTIILTTGVTYRVEGNRLILTATGNDGTTTITFTRQ